MTSRALRVIGSGALAAVLALGACGGEEQPGVSEIEDTSGESGSSSASGSATASGETASGESAPAFTKAEADSVVKVTVREWEIVAEPTVVKGPKVYFEVTNEGEDVHEMAVTSPGATDEEGAYGEVAGIKTGWTGPLALELAPGTYQLACFIVETEASGEHEDHFQKGMKTEIEVQ